MFWFWLLDQAFNAGDWSYYKTDMNRLLMLAVDLEYERRKSCQSKLTTKNRNEC